MWWTLGGSVALALSIVMLWYWLFTRWNRRRAQRLLGRIESAFGGQGHLSGVHWISASQFLVSLRLPECNFTQPYVSVRMLPREMPLSWIHSIAKKRRETVTFAADLLCPPGFNLEVQNQRWWGKDRKRVMKKSPVVRLKHVGPFVLTSRREWQKDITSMMHALAASRDCDLLSVSFKKTSPHFSATIPLETISDQQSPVRIFETLRELASGASAARF